MPGIATTAASFLPRWLLARAACEPVALRSAQARPMLAAVVFADISGFTELTRRCLREGHAGVERLTQEISDYLSGLIGRIEAAGGDIEKIYGDAVLAFWLAEPGDEAGLGEAVLRAAACARELFAGFGDHRISDDLVLRLRAAVVAGEVQAVQLGGGRGRFEFLLAGQCLLEIGDLLARSEPGQVLLSEAAWRRIAPVARGRRTGSGAVLLEDLRAKPDAALPPAALPEVADDGPLRGYLPSTLRHRIDEPEIGWLAEFRRLTVMFTSLPEVGCATPSELQRFQAAVRAFQDVLYRYEGSILQIAMNDKGPLILAVFGLPHNAHGDDPLRAVLAAREIHGALDALAVPSCIGIATGTSYCGCVGSEERRNYTVMGDAIIRAVRLMSARARPVLCDAATMAAAQARLAFARVGDLDFKGKYASIEAFEPQGQRDAAPAPADAFVGRRQELALLKNKLQDLLRTGRRSVVYIDGEAGMGKSTLIERFRREASDLVEVHYAAADAIEGGAPYAIWKPIFAGWLGDASGPEPVREAVERMLIACGLDPRLAPLANPLLPTALPDSELTAQMQGEVRAENTREVLTGLVWNRLERDGGVVVLEDVHWMDSASWSLALRIAADAQGLLILIASRPQDAQSLPALAELLGQGDVERLQLQAVDREAIVGVLESSLKADSIDPRIVDVIVERAAGNPFFSRELALALRASGAIVVEGGACRLAPGVDDLTSVELPDSLQRAILARVDRFPAALQLTLKVASVIGRAFSHAALESIFPVADRKAALADDLQRLAAYEIVRIEARTPELLCAFNHAATHEVVYNLLLYAQRRALHGSLAGWLERQSGASRPVSHGVLAHHWSRAERHDKALHSWEAAGLESLAGGAYPEAVRAFVQAVDALEKCDGADPDSLVAVRLKRQLGEAHLHSGRLESGRVCFNEALAKLRRPWPRSKAAFLWRLVREIGAQTLQAAAPPRWSGRGLDDVRDREAARLYEFVGHIAGHTNDMQGLALATIAALNASGRLSDRAQFSRAAAFFSLMLRVAGLPGLAERYLERSRRDLPDRSRPGDRAMSNEYRALYLISTGRLAEAKEVLEEALELARGINDRRRLRDLTSLLAITLSAMGETGRAAELQEAFAAAADADGDPQLRCWARLEQAEMALLLGRPEAAAAHIAAVLPLLPQVGTSEAVWAHGLRALAELRCGRADAALAAAAEGLDHMRRTPFLSFYAMSGAFGALEAVLECEARGAAAVRRRPSSRRMLARALRFAKPHPLCQPRAHLLEGRRHLVRGDPSRAEAALRRALEDAMRIGLPYEMALAHEQLAQLGRGTEEARRHHEKAEAILARLRAPHQAAGAAGG